MKFKKMTKRGASFFLALVMCVSLLQVPAYATEVPETANPVAEATEPAAEPAPAPAPEVTPEPEPTPAPPAASVNQESTSEPDPEPAPEVPPVQEEPAPEGEASMVPPAANEITPQEPDNTVIPGDGDEIDDSETPEDVDTISPEAQAFLDAVKVLDDATNAGADFDTLSALAEACQNAFDALSDIDLDREDVASAVAQFSGLMPEEPATMSEGEENIAPPEAVKAQVKDIDELNSALDDASVNVISLVNDIVGNITIGRSLTLDLGGKTLTGTGNGSVITTKNDGSEEVNVTIQNGTITGGKAKNGGGIYVGKNTSVTLDNAGTVTGNVAVNSGRRDGTGSGGGVYIANGGSFILNGGTISGNESKTSNSVPDNKGEGSGGGIYVAAGSSFTMNSGTINNNKADQKGGGICLSSDGYRFNKAEILSGIIKGNAADYGAGIYVAGGNTLNLLRVAITGNLANVEDWTGTGGGVWFCQSGGGKFYATNGSYISGNSAYKEGNDFFAERFFRSPITPIKISSRLYDGSKVNWYLDGQSGSWSGPRYTSGSSAIENMEDLISRWMSDDNPYQDNFNLHSVTTGSGNDDYYALYIMDNTAMSGGGIACNGTLIMGEDKDISLKVNKVWNLEEGVTLPEFITVNVLNNGKVIDTVTLNAENGWSATIDGLPSDGTNYELQEVSADGYDVSYGEIVKGEDGTWSLSVTNSTPKPKTTSLTINKVWDVEEGAALPESITASVFNGEVLVDTVTLNAGNGWKTTLDGLPIDGTYTVSEAAVPGYDADVTGGKAEDGTWSFTITNTPVVPETTSLTINKVWDVEEGTALPESITASVFNGETLVTNVTLNADNQWTTTLNDLPIDGKYSVSEVTVPGYTASINGSQAEDGTWSFTITNTPNPVVPTTTTLTVNKVWSDGADIHVDGSVIVNVLDAMNAIFKTVTLNAANNWTATVDGLSVDVKYTVQEVAVNGYTPSYTENEDGSITITNTLIPTTPDRPSRPDRPTTPPPTDIPDPDVPLSPGPEPEEPPVTIDEPDVPLAGEPPITEIPEPDVPLAEQPPVTTIPEPEVPLSDVPMTGDASGLWYAVLGLAACGLVVLNLRKKEAL